MRVVSQRVAPSASAASRCVFGTASSTSRLTAVMNGTTMMARTMPAASIPTPYGGPLNSGRNPRVAPRNGCSHVRSSGARTKMPHSP